MQVITSNSHWKLREPATSSQWQSALKIKPMIAAAVFVITAVTAADTTNHVESTLSKLKCILLAVIANVCSL